VIRDVIAQYDLAELIRSSKRTLPNSNDSVKQAAEIADAALPQEIAQDKPVVTAIKFGRAKLLDMIREESKRRLVEQGEGEEDIGGAIEIVDVGVSQVMFVESVRQNTFDRWISERGAISMGILKEGETRKAMIINAANAEVQKIEGRGQKEASEIRGKVDAEMIRRYAEAISQVGDFYTFTRTLSAYESAINKDSRMILSTDNEFLKMIQALGEGKK
jgi:membrane protease subunit HflC